ncbi:MAG: hypothetical protein SFV52_15090 [Saprospiraceae bacterium]|nr:hypothetical protein [Saprospiraceae bacterium]
MKTVFPNIFMLVLRLILLPFCIWLVVAPIVGFINNKLAGKEWVMLVGLFFFVFFLAFIVLSLLGVFILRYNEDTEEIRLYRMYGFRTLFARDIAGYYQSTLQSRWKNYTGIILILKDGSSIELTEYNVKPIKDFYDFLVKSGVPFNGKRESWYPLIRK